MLSAYRRTFPRVIRASEMERVKTSAPKEPVEAIQAMTLRRALVDEDGFAKEIADRAHKILDPMTRSAGSDERRAVVPLHRLMSGVVF